MPPRSLSDHGTQLEIWNRILAPDCPDIPPEAAAFILRMNLTKADRDRVQELNRKANEGRLSQPERVELEEFLRVSDVLAIMQSKARRSLKSHGQAS